MSHLPALSTFPLPFIFTESSCSLRGLFPLLGHGVYLLSPLPYHRYVPAIPPFLPLLLPSVLPSNPSSLTPFLFFPLPRGSQRLFLPLVGRQSPKRNEMGQVRWEEGRESGRGERRWYFEAESGGRPLLSSFLGFTPAASVRRNESRSHKSHPFPLTPFSLNFFPGVLPP